jgi:hypothetical protein
MLVSYLQYVLTFLRMTDPLTDGKENRARTLKLFLCFFAEALLRMVERVTACRLKFQRWRFINNTLN